MKIVNKLLGKKNDVFKKNIMINVEENEEKSDYVLHCIALDLL